MYQEHVLDNGLRILLVPVPGFQSVSVGVFVRIGSRYERTAESGICHLIEHMLFKGTTRRPTAKLIAEAIEGIGGINNAYTDYETTVYYAKVAASQATTVVNILADMIRHPLFDPDELEKERQIIGEEINMVYDTPDDWIDELIDQVVWPDHPLGRSVAGTHDSLAGISRASLVGFYACNYHPQNLIIVVSGSFQPEAVLAEVETMLGDWRPAAAPEFETAPGPQTEARWRIEDRPIEQGHLCLALPGLPRTHPDRYALGVLNTILGEGMSSRLFLTIREELGLAYAVDSSLTLLQDTGTLVIYAGVDSARAAQALQAILNELDRLAAEPVPAKELHKAKEYIKGRLVLGLENSFSWATWVAYQTLFQETVKTPEQVLQAYDAVTAAEVQAMARQIISPAGYNLAAVGPFRQGDALVKLMGG
jgi:predicted Zn-dependent peptidase